MDSVILSLSWIIWYTVRQGLSKTGSQEPVWLSKLIHREAYIWGSLVLASEPKWDNGGPTEKQSDVGEKGRSKAVQTDVLGLMGAKWNVTRVKTAWGQNEKHQDNVHAGNTNRSLWGCACLATCSHVPGCVHWRGGGPRRGTSNAMSWFLNRIIKRIKIP